MDKCWYVVKEEEGQSGPGGDVGADVYYGDPSAEESIDLHHLILTPMAAFGCDCNGGITYEDAVDLVNHLNATGYLPPTKDKSDDRKQVERP